MSMPEVVDPDSPVDVGGRERRLPHTLTEPATRNVAVGVKRPSTPRVVLPLETARRPVLGIRGLAMLTVTLAQRVSSQRPVPVPPAGAVRLSPAECFRIGQYHQPRRRIGGHCEQQVI